MNFLTMTMLLSRSVPMSFRSRFACPNLALENEMATRAFRAIILGILKDETSLEHSYELSTSRAHALPPGEHLTCEEPEHG
jgi:hypothetical protein